jgi:MFS family permease
MEARWRALWVLSAARVAMGVQFQAVGATAPLLQQAFGLSYADVGWLVGLYLLPGVVLALPGGMLSARLGDRRVAILGAALMVAGGALCAAAADTGTLQAGRLLGGIGGVLFNVTGAKMIADWFAGREIELAMSVFVGTWPLGIGLALLVLGPAAAASSPSVAFALSASIALVSLLLVTWVYRPAPGAAAAATPRLSALAPGDGLRLALAASAWTLYNVAFALLVTFLPTLFATRGLPPGQASALAAALTATVIVSVPASGWVVQRSGRPLAVAIVGMIGWIACVGAVWAGGSPTPWLLAGGLLAGSAAGVLVAAPARFLSPAARPVGLGLFYTAFYAGMALLPRALGTLADALGTSEVVLPASIACVVLTIVLLVATQRVLRTTP